MQEDWPRTVARRNRSGGGSSVILADKLRWGGTMALNLINDRWIPVRRADQGPSVIRPDEMADPAVVFPAWPRADLNIACLELLIGLVFLGDPPVDEGDWQDRKAPDSMRLRDRLARLAPAFELTGDGPRFLQDLEPVQGEVGPPDRLFVDSAGATRRGTTPI